MRWCSLLLWCITVNYPTFLSCWQGECEVLWGALSADLRGWRLRSILEPIFGFLVAQRGIQRRFLPLSCRLFIPTPCDWGMNHLFFLILNVVPNERVIFQKSLQFLETILVHFSQVGGYLVSDSSGIFDDWHTDQGSCEPDVLTVLCGDLRVRDRSPMVKVIYAIPIPQKRTESFWGVFA